MPLTLGECSLPTLKLVQYGEGTVLHKLHKL